MDTKKLDPTPYRLQLGVRDSLLLHVTEGPLWLTQEGYPDDEVMVSGALRVLRGPGRYWLSAFATQATIRFLESESGSPSASPKPRTAAPGGAA